MLRKKIMGGNFGATEMFTLEENMGFRLLRPTEDRLRPWPELPPVKTARERTAALLEDIYRRERNSSCPP